MSNWSEIINNFYINNDPNLIGVEFSWLGFDPSVLNTPSITNTSSVTTRFIRKNDVIFDADSMCPDKVANIFFDQTSINAYCQKPNKLTFAAGTEASKFIINEGVVNSSTNAFARVISSSDNLLYLNQNFITLNVLAFAANTLGSSTYVEGDLVYQTASLVDTTITFQGRVEFYDSTNKIMAIAPTSGSVNAVLNAANSVIRKINGTVLSNATSVIQGNMFPLGSTVRSTSNASNTAIVSSSATHEHRSGMFLTYAGSDIVVQNDLVSADVSGLTLRITSGSAAGESRTITGVTSNKQIALSSPISGLTSNSRYTIGNHVVDEYGKICGIFNIPETENVKFPVGERILTITDTATAVDNEYIMRAVGAYKVVGRPAEPVSPPTVITPPSNPVIPAASRRRRRDPLAQTFFTPEANEIVNGLPKPMYGIYVSSIDIWFSSKPDVDSNQDVLPVFVQIVEVVNGLPTEKVLATSTVPWRKVNVTTTPIPNDSNNYTKFKFPDPVYLKPDSEYALVVLSDSPEYSVYVSELGGNILGSSPPRRVSEQPYAGSLFKSQNASTWTPIQNQDLMFRINKCVFTANQLGVVTLKPKPQTANVFMDSLLIHSAELNHQPTVSRYKFKSNNVLNVTDPTFTYLEPNKLYRFGSDLSTSNKTSNRRRVVIAGDSNSFTAGVEMSSTDDDVSPVVSLERIGLLAYEAYVNNGSFGNTDISITNPGAHLNAANIVVMFSEPNIVGGTRANAYIAGLAPGGALTSSNVIIDVAGSGYSGNITMNIAEPSATVNATAIVSNELRSVGGNAKARYISKAVTLADNFDAGDLRVYMDCNRPRGTHIEVYSKVKSETDPQNLSEKNWQLMSRVSDIYSADQNQIIELEYRPSAELGTFKQFAVKIVLLADDSTVPPNVRNLRAIATPAG